MFEGLATSPLFNRICFSRGLWFKRIEIAFICPRDFPNVYMDYEHENVESNIFNVNSEIILELESQICFFLFGIIYVCTCHMIELHN